ncbi:hypothetical protein CYLTODRAFT_424835 [Cylindrobasidium torrendii FP15055 ss-10]|uniref:Uncharacterized protein n=1 Tax=Cylindrobasidium torrendii FP15055 ss-10 TaxID=1314674 RepID=A0A0D7B3V3_9AGAR|nr:hypothetical protein CYLTODRAFT_424835 [Cylindrobasidium torrendii FP15055 ss-10]
MTDTLLSSLNCEVARIDEEINRTLQRLDALKDSQGIAKSKIRELQGHSAAQAIPDDVLREIFEYCVPWCRMSGCGSDSFPENSSLDSTLAPWTISQVCRNWRSVALSHPRLWATWHIPLGSGSNTFQSHLHGIQVLRVRSAGIPLRLSIFQTRNSRMGSNIVHWLSTHCMSRVADAHVTLPKDSAETLFHLHWLPSLTSLWLSVHGTESADPIELRTPALRQVHRACGALSSIMVELPWHQITHYTSELTSLECVGNMQNLRALTIIRDSEDPFRKPVSQRIELAQLTYLHINEMMSFGETCDAFQLCVFPSIHTLVIDIPVSMATLFKDVPALPTLLNISISLSTDNVDMEDEDYLELVEELDLAEIAKPTATAVRRAPNLQILHLAGDAIEQVIYALAEQAGPLSELKDVCITGSGEQQTAKALLSLINGRKMAGHSNLENITFYSNGQWEHDEDWAYENQMVLGAFFLQYCANDGTEVCYVNDGHEFDIPC